MEKMVFVKGDARKVTLPKFKEELLAQGWKIAGNEEQKQGNGSLESLEEESGETSVESESKPAAKPGRKKKA